LKLLGPKTEQDLKAAKEPAKDKKVGLISQQ
jgi:hypothetical protein